jgi:hypothetical protein
MASMTEAKVLFDSHLVDGEDGASDEQTVGGRGGLNHCVAGAPLLLDGDGIEGDRVGRVDALGFIQQAKYALKNAPSGDGVQRRLVVAQRGVHDREGVGLLVELHQCQGGVGASRVDSQDQHDAGPAEGIKAEAGVSMESTVRCNTRRSYSLRQCQDGLEEFVGVL